MNFESLESRRLMSASLNSATGLLTVQGSAQDDAITVSLSANKTQVVVKQNGVTQSFLKSKVKKIAAFGNAGNDSIIVSQAITIPAELWAGPSKVASYLDGEYLEGGGGNDILHGDFTGTGVNTNGGGGNDVIYAGSESSNHGGPGNDTIYTKGSELTAYGDAGDDKFVLSGLSENQIVGGAGLDTADFSSFTEDLTIGNQSALNARGIGLWSGPGTKPTYLSGVVVSDDIEVLKGGHGNDRIYGWSGVNQLYGNDGNDVLDGGAGKDALFGGNGNDTLYARDGVADFLSGGTGTDKGKVDALDQTTGVEIFLA